jgi:hypothetical protein
MACSAAAQEDVHFLESTAVQDGILDSAHRSMVRCNCREKDDAKHEYLHEDHEERLQQESAFIF